MMNEILIVSGTGYFSRPDYFGLRTGYFIPSSCFIHWVYRSSLTIVAVALFVAAIA